MKHVHFAARSDADETPHHGPALCRAGLRYGAQDMQQVAGDWEHVTCRTCKRMLAARNRQDDRQGHTLEDWMDRIFVVTPDLQATMDREGWCISNSDRYGWQVERDDEQDKLRDDEAAQVLARASGVPINLRGQLQKYPVHFRDLEAFDEAQDRGYRR